MEESLTPAQKDIFDNLSKKILDKDAYIEWIDNQNLNKDLKNTLKAILDVTAKIGQRVYSFGKFVLDVIITFVKKFPNTALYIAIASILAIIISSIPLIGGYIATIATPFFILLGGVKGVIEDVMQNPNSAKIKTEIEKYFSGQ